MKTKKMKIASKQSSEATQYNAREKREEVMIHKAYLQHHCDGSTHQERSSLHRFRTLIAQRDQQETRLCSADPLPGESGTEAKTRSLISRWF